MQFMTAALGGRVERAEKREYGFAELSIATTDGRELVRTLDYPKGDPRNPMSDQELDDKFDALADPVMSRARREAAKSALRGVERLDRAEDLLDALFCDRLP